MDLQDDEDGHPAPPVADGGGSQGHGQRGADRQDPQDLDRRIVVIRERAKEEGRNEGGNAADRKGGRDQMLQAIALEHRAERDEPHSHRQGVNEKEGRQLGVFFPPADIILHPRRTHGAGLGGKWGVAAGNLAEVL